MNTRGGPGIVLASVALAAGLIKERFYVTLVMAALLTSLASGMWIRRPPRLVALPEIGALSLRRRSQANADLRMAWRRRNASIVGYRHRGIRGRDSFAGRKAVLARLAAFRRPTLVAQHLILDAAMLEVVGTHVKLNYWTDFEPNEETARSRSLRSQAIAVFRIMSRSS